MRLQVQDVKNGSVPLKERKDGFSQKGLTEGLQKSLIENHDGWLRKNEAVGRFVISRKQLDEWVREGKVEVAQERNTRFHVYNPAQIEKAVRENPGVQQADGEIPDGWLRMHDATRKHHISCKTLKKMVEERKVTKRLEWVRYSYQSGYSCQEVYREAYVYNSSQIEQALATYKAALIEETSEKRFERGRPRATKNQTDSGLHERIRAAVRTGLSNTQKEFQKDFSKNILRPLWKMLNGAFGSTAVLALEAVMSAKRPERTESYPKPKNEHWEMIMGEARECIMLMEIAHEMKVELNLREQYGFTSCKDKAYGSSALERTLPDADGRPVTVRVWGRRPRVLSFYLKDDDFVLGSSLRFNHDTTLKLQAVENCAGNGALDVREFEDSLNYRLMRHSATNRPALEITKVNWKGKGKA